MFKNLQKELARLSALSEMSVPIGSDKEGYIDRECPAQECLFLFKVNGDDWTNIVHDEEVFCPSCRHAAPASSWFTTAQVDAAKQYAVGAITNGINKAMRADAAASKRRQTRNSFLSITLEAKGGRDAVLIPIAAAEPMRLRTACEDCGCRYSYIGAAYFCPACGANSATHTFSETLKTIRTAARVCETLRGTLDLDEAEVMIRSLLEKSMQDTVTSFQRLSERLYERRTGKIARRNVFQNLEAGSVIWESELGENFSQMIGPAALAQLRVYFQQRHLLAHQQGIVDQDYITRSGDKTYDFGQRLVIRNDAVLEFAGLVEKLGDQLTSRCGP